MKNYIPIPERNGIVASEIILMIDSDLIKDDISYFGEPEYHWVVLTSKMTISNIYNTKYQYENDNIMTVNFKVYSWGSDRTYLTKPITLNHFKYNFYGYIKLK